MVREQRTARFLPTGLMAHAQNEPLAGAGFNPGLGRASLKVLIVEDELLVAWHLEALLTDLGHQVCATASHLEAALADFDEHRPDLVFMDVNLGPGLSGIEVARRIRALAPAPIVFVTAYTDPRTRNEMAEAAVGAPVLSKPVSSRDLAEAIEAATRLKN